MRDAGQAAALWRLDVKGADVRAHLAAAGVPTLLLKGRAFAALLYADGAPRPYGDCDLLVPPRLTYLAQQVLRELGLVPCGGGVHATDWRRPADRFSVDLHQTLPGCGAEPQHVWSTLFARSTSMTVGGAETRVLDPAAAALLASLHIVHHGPGSIRPREDLERAISCLDAECWAGAAALARELEATAALGTGLRLVPTGTAVAERLNLAWAPSSRTLIEWSDAPWAARVWESLSGATGLRARAAVVRGLLAPSSEFLRERSALARAGWGGLLLAFVVRPVLLAAKLLFALGPWRRGHWADGGAAAATADRVAPLSGPGAEPDRAAPARPPARL
jgi:hypothetical protein